jgi:two-component SAPR family response regulator
MYDLLILDIRIPGMNGFKLYEKIRDLDNEVKVCFLTAFKEYLGEFKTTFPFLNEVNCYLKEPITIQDLVKRLESLAKTLIALKIFFYQICVKAFFRVGTRYSAECYMLYVLLICDLKEEFSPACLDV